jgi:hypothetical protein
MVSHFLMGISTFKFPLRFLLLGVSFFWEVLIIPHAQSLSRPLWQRHCDSQRASEYLNHGGRDDDPNFPPDVNDPNFPPDPYASQSGHDSLHDSPHGSPHHDHSDLNTHTDYLQSVAALQSAHIVLSTHLPLSGQLSVDRFVGRLKTLMEKTIDTTREESGNVDGGHGAHQYEEGLKGGEVEDYYHFRCQ